MKLVPARALIVALGVLVMPLAVTASASAFSVDGVSVGVTASSGPLPPSGPAAAGAHPDQSTTISFSDAANPNADSVRSLELHLAPGIVAYVNHVPICRSFDETTQDPTSCPNSIVGSTTTAATTYTLAPIPLPLPLPPIPVGNVSLTLRGTIYRIAPAAGKPAAFGIDIDPPLPGLSRIKLVSPISVDPHDLGLTASLDGLPDTTTILASEAPVHIDSITQTLFGYTAARQSFFTNPTACIPAAVTVTATSYGGATSRGSSSYTPTDCAHVPFRASLAVAANPSTADTTSAISFDVKPGTDDVPRVSSHVKTTTVIAPPGVLLNSALAAQLEACTDEQFAQSDTSVQARCSPTSAVGDIDFVSPILGSFPGKAYFGTQTPTDRLRLFLDVPLYGAHIKISATVNPDFRTGQITTKFSALPQIAFTDFRLTFRGGDQSALVTPTTCGDNVATAIVGPWSGGPETTASSSFVTTDCNRLFAPGFANSVSTGQAGASPTFTLVAERPDRQVPIGRMTYSLPPGLVGALAMPGLTQCSLVDAAAQRCPASSKVGDVVSVVGSGGLPPSLPGTAYLTAPKQAGDPAALSIQVPARLGPVDAGTVIVGVRLALRNDGGLDVISDDIPALQLGIPLAIRRLTVTMNRAGFMRNPTSCGAKQSTADFTPLDGGAHAGGTSSITIDGCDRLPFAPRLTATLGARGATKEGVHPPFTTVITQRPGEAALKTVRVKTPTAMSTNIRTVAAACDPAVLAQDRCAEASHVAEARAESPLVSGALTGPTWLVKRTKGLPKLVVHLRGPASIDLEGIVTTDSHGALITTFSHVPDLTISSFELKFRGGRDGIFTAVQNLCARRLLTSTGFVGQNDKTTQQREALKVVGCPKAKPKATATLRLRRGTASLAVVATAPLGGKPLSSLRVALPKGLELRRPTTGAARATGGRRRLGPRAIKAGPHAVTVKLGRRGAQRVSLQVRRLTVTSASLARRLGRRRGTLPMKVGTRLTNGARTTIKVRARIR